MAAVVAGEQPVGPMEDQGHVALRAAPDPAARRARDEIRPAATVEEDDRLAAVGAQLLAILADLEQFSEADVQTILATQRKEDSHE